MYEENKINYLKINVKIEDKMKTIRLYDYFINDILKIIYEDSSYFVYDIQKLSKDEKKDIIKYVYTILEKNVLSSYKNLNYDINRMIYINIVKSLKTKNKEQSKIEF